MVRRSRSVLSVCLLVLGLTGCQTLPNPWKDLPPPATVLTSAVPVWERLATRRQELETLRGLARVRLQVATREAALDDTVVVMQRFETIRLEGIGPVGQPLFLLIADAQELALYAPQEGRLLSGAATAENLLRLFGIALTPRSLQYVLAGDVPMPVLPSTGVFAYRARDNLYAWQGQLPGDPLTYRIWFEPYDLQPVRFEMDDLSGRLLLQVRYEGFQPVNGFRIPSRITVDQPRVGRQVVWEYKDVECNTRVMPSLFRMRVPSGTPRTAIEDLLEPEADRLPRIW